MRKNSDIWYKKPLSLEEKPLSLEEKPLSLEEKPLSLKSTPLSLRGLRRNDTPYKNPGKASTVNIFEDKHVLCIHSNLTYPDFVLEKTRGLI